jgi:hypothetical protein
MGWEVLLVQLEGVWINFAVSNTYGPERVWVVTAGYTPAASKTAPRSPHLGI